MWEFTTYKVIVYKNKKEVGSNIHLTSMKEVKNYINNLVIDFDQYQIEQLKVSRHDKN